jgi:hypothetical protein
MNAPCPTPGDRAQRKDGSGYCQLPSTQAASAVPR